jgi:hypothetical protein
MLFLAGVVRFFLCGSFANKRESLKEDAGWEDYDLRITATLRGDVAKWNLPAGMSMTHLLAIGSPEWQLRESDSLKRPQNRRQGIQVKTA